MKLIRGHRSFNRGEIIDIFSNHGCYTCPTLPHYRYTRVKQACWDLERAGLVRRTGKTSVSVNLAVTDLFREWKRAAAAGATTLGPVRWAKERLSACLP